MPKQPPPTPTGAPADLAADEVERRQDIAVGIIADGLIKLLLRERFEQLDREDQEKRIAEEEAKGRAEEQRARRRQRRFTVG